MKNDQQNISVKHFELQYEDIEPVKIPVKINR